MLLCADLGSPCGAADPEWFVSIGAFDPTASTNIRFDGPSGVGGTNLHVEDDLGLPDRRAVPQAALGYRFNRDATLEAGYFELRRTGSRVVDETIVYGGVTYNINNTVSTLSDMQVGYARYRYAFLHKHGWDISLVAGLHYTRFKLGLDDLTTQQSQTADADAALPLLGAQAAYISGEWHLKAEATYFKMTVNGIHGNLLEYSLAAAYLLRDDLSVELGWSRFVLSLAADRMGLNGNARLAYQGPYLSLCYGCR